MAISKKVYILSAVRTPIGKLGGMLSSLKAEELGSIVIKEGISRANISPECVSEVLMGCAIQAGLGQNVSRQAAIRAGVPIEVPASTINNVCGSSLKAINLAAALIICNHAQIVVAGGMESMSQSPYVLNKARFGYRMGNGQLVDAMINDALWDYFNDCHMGITAENIAEKYNITRLEQDEFAAYSQQKCERARIGNLFSSEIVPVPIKQKKETFIVSNDEYPRDGVTIESISSLKPAFKENGSITAANSSGINDGAACVVMASEEAVAKYGLKPIAEWICGTHVGVDPKLMGIGAGIAAKKVMEDNGFHLDDIDLIEANEAFASQSIASARIGGWDKCMNKVNVNGGAIALGHPVGTSGCRILVTLIHELNRRKGKFGLATLCVGGGMGVATIVKGINDYGE